MIFMGIHEDCRVQITRMDELGCVMARGQTNVDRMGCSGGSIIVFQSLSKRMRGNAHDRIHLRIKIMWPPQGLDGNAVLLDFVDCPFEILLADKGQESNKVVRSPQHPGR